MSNYVYLLKYTESTQEDVTGVYNMEKKRNEKIKRNLGK